jgi:hypothetical protein
MMVILGYEETLSDDFEGHDGDDEGDLSRKCIR